MLKFTTQESLKRHLLALPTNTEIGFVPTMGSIHDGHLSLIERANKENDRVVVSIFVNPTQFNNEDDFKNYPVDTEGDVLKIESVVSNPIIYLPTVEDVYGENVVAKKIDLNGLDEAMEGKYRMGHFEGVASVVSFFLNLIKPDCAYFGEKDFQQLQIVRFLVRKMCLPVRIIGCTTHREDGGLAMSSRNKRLSKSARKKSDVIYREISRASELLKSFSVDQVKKKLRVALTGNKDFDLEYLEFADEESLIPVMYLLEGRTYRLFIAIYVEGVRLIDNIVIKR